MYIIPFTFVSSQYKTLAICIIFALYPTVKTVGFTAISIMRAAKQLIEP